MIAVVEADEFLDLDWLSDMLKDDLNVSGIKIWPPGKNGEPLNALSKEKPPSSLSIMECHSKLLTDAVVNFMQQQDKRRVPDVIFH